jgi:hypothetical protein
MTKVVSGQGIIPVTKASVRPSRVAAWSWRVESERHSRKDLADHREAKQHEDEGKSDMGEGKDGAVGEAIDWARRLAEMIGDEDRLAVAWHQRMHCAEQDCCGQGEEDGACVSARDVGEALAHAAVKPVLNGEQRLHRLVRARMGVPLGRWVVCGLVPVWGRHRLHMQAFQCG